MNLYNEEYIVSMAKKLFEAGKEKIFAGLLIREGVGTYPWYDFSKSTRESRAKRKMLWETKQGEIERQAFEETMASVGNIPGSLRRRIQKELGVQADVPQKTLPKCSVCGKEIQPKQGTIGQDIHQRGGVVVGGTGLDETLYRGTICRSCGRLYCMDCHDFTQKGYNCPNCGQSISPLFADYLPK